MSRRKDRNHTEHILVKAIHEKALFDEIMPALRAIAASGGSVEAMLKKSAPMAAVKLASLIHSEKEDVAMRAAEKIIAYDLGKPVERSVNVFADVARMNERDIDSQIKRLLENSGAQQIIDAQVSEKPALPPAPKIKQKRKPRNGDPLKDGSN